jgi:hypothetical protein
LNTGAVATVKAAVAAARIGVEILAGTDVMIVMASEEARRSATVKVSVIAMVAAVRVVQSLLEEQWPEMTQSAEQSQS